MSSNEATTTKIVLTRPDDWEPWYNQCRSNIDARLWAYVDPDGPEKPLPVEPVRPEITQFDRNATSYAGLSQALQRQYENARRFYDADMKEFETFMTKYTNVRAWITQSVSSTKAKSLRPEMTTKQWLQILRSSTKPKDGYLQDKTRDTYRTTIQRFKPTSQWFDEWETVMAEAIQYELPEVSGGIWLRDLAKAIQPTSDALHVTLMMDAQDTQKTDPENYRDVVISARSILQRPTSGRTSRGTANHVTFGDSQEHEGFDTTKLAGDTGPPLPKKGRKRAAGAMSEETVGTPKKAAVECRACGGKGHSLDCCWSVFPEERPEGIRPNRYRNRKVKETLEENAELRKEVEGLRKSRGYLIQVYS
jgi:hypothetical protein